MGDFVNVHDGLLHRKRNVLKALNNYLLLVQFFGIKTKVIQIGMTEHWVLCRSERHFLTNVDITR